MKSGLTPIQRLGLWTGTSFAAVTPESIAAPRVFVLSHGWAPGMRAVVRAADGDIRVWDDGAVTADGERFDEWYGPLAAQIRRTVPDAAVLGFSWIDESATAAGNLNGIRSQLRTTVNGQRLAVAIDEALPDGAKPDIHLIGFSHGARIVTIAATVMEPTPRQVTLLDSPEGALPIVGGALNDLTSYLRVLTRPEDGLYGVSVDNYPSFFGVRYGRHPGLRGVVDVKLEPERHPLDPDARRSWDVQELGSAFHLYAADWYVETARRGLDIGFGWSRVVDPERWPTDTEYRQVNGMGPFDLEVTERDTDPATSGEIVDRARLSTEKPRTLTTPGNSTLSTVAVRRGGDLLAVAPIRWIDARPDATLRVFLNGVERGLAVRRWSDTAAQRVIVHLGDVRGGLVAVRVVLDSAEPATVEVGQVTSIYRVPLPAFAEYRTWLFPAFVATLAGLIGAVATLATRAILRSVSSWRSSR